MNTGLYATIDPNLQKTFENIVELALPGSLIKLQPEPARHIYAQLALTIPLIASRPVLVTPLIEKALGPGGLQSATITDALLAEKTLVDLESEILPSVL